MDAKNTFQLSTKAAEGYETQKVPALFSPLARATIEAISLPESAQVIDIACGTGIITRVVAAQLTGAGRIVGTDLNSAMLEVAEKTMPKTSHVIEWFACDVTELPFGDGEFDIAFCQQDLQFFPDKPKALEHFQSFRNREGFPGGRICDSRCVLEKEASMHGEISFQGSSRAACRGG